MSSPPIPSVLTFDWRVEASSAGNGEFIVRSVRFGEGYAQETSDALNNEKQKWNVVFSGMRDQVAEVLGFIRYHQGYKSFYWTPPLSDRGLYKCKRYQPADQGGNYWVLSMEFEQAFSP